jgi:hypothetical protein
LTFYLFSGAAGVFFIFLIVQVKSLNETAITDPFEDDEDLRYAADAFCKEYSTMQPMGKIVLPYKPNCHFW